VDDKWKINQVGRGEMHTKSKRNIALEKCRYRHDDIINSLLQT
jgi:hypothetical protein